MRVARKPPIEEVPELAEAVTKAEEALGDSGRVLFRYSGTEPKARVMVEGEDEIQIRALAEELSAVAKNVLGAEE